LKNIWTLIKFGETYKAGALIILQSCTA